MKELFLTGLFFVTILTTLTVEGIKKLLGEKPYNANLLAAIVATTLSLCVAIFYVLWNGFLLYIDQYSTVQECIDDYNEQVKRDGFYAGFKNGEYIKTDDLGKKIAKIFASL